MVNFFAEENMPRFRPIKQTRISDEVTEQIKESILVGEIRAGDKLPSEFELMEQFQVSRVAVREAIRSLENAGFLAIRQGAAGGTYVTELSFERLSEAFLDLFLVDKISMPELCKARQIIEPEVARVAATKLTPEYARSLVKALEDEETPFRSLFEDVEIKTVVHAILVEICGNRFIEALVRSLMKLTRQVVVAVHRDSQSLHPAGMHRPIVEAVLARKPDEAAEAMRIHAVEFGKIMIEMEKTFRQNMVSGLEMRIPGQSVSSMRKKKPQ
jgi:GntR family transcriptional regulator, transcriptional repressor for pyruvate dehydrogenase complex